MRRVRMAILGIGRIEPNHVLTFAGAGTGVGASELISAVPEVHAQRSR